MENHALKVLEFFEYDGGKVDYHQVFSKELNITAFSKYLLLEVLQLCLTHIL